MEKHYLYQRRVLGILCALLAPLCVLTSLICYKANYLINPGFWNTVSETYFTTSKMIMIGMLSATGLFLITYQGYDKKDFIFNKIEGLLSLCVVMFPCNCPTIERCGFFNLPCKTSLTIHSIVAVLLFTMFSIQVLWLFRLSSPSPTPEKIKRNKIYLICGIIMVINIVLMILRTVCGFPRWTGIIFENFILMPYGIAFLIKGEAFERFNDKTEINLDALCKSAFDFLKESEE